MINEVSVPDEIILNNIYLIRGEKVMLNRDLADLYGSETRTLKQGVKRNIERFPGDFMFQLTKAVYGLEITKCDVQSRPKGLAACSYGIHRTWCSYVIQRT